MEEQKMITVKEIAEKYKISRQTIMRMVDKGYITAHRLPEGRKLYFLVEDVEKLFKKQD